MMCCAIVRGRRGECQRPVPEGCDLALCLLHLVMAHQEVAQRGGVQALRAAILQEAR